MKFAANLNLKEHQFFYSPCTFVLRVENNTQLIPSGIHFFRIIQGESKKTDALSNSN